MKRVLATLLALAFCLTACAPAASESAGEAPADAATETAPEEETPETAVPPVGTLTMNSDAREDSTGYYDTSIWKNPDTGENR